MSAAAEKSILSPSIVTFDGRGLQLLLLTVAASAALYARTALSPLQEAIRVALGLSDNQIALLQGLALALPVVVTAVPIGILIDRCSRVRILVFFAILSVAGSVLTAAATNFSWLFFARSLVGLTAPATWIAASSLIADFYEPAHRGRATMVVAIGQFLGMSAVFAFGGELLVMSGSGSEGWRWSMLWLTAPLVLVMFLLFAMREPPRTDVTLEHPSTRRVLAECWRLRAVIAPLFAGIVMLEMALGSVMIWAAPTLSRGFAVSPDRVGAIMAMVVLVSGVVGPIAGGMVADLCQRTGGPRRTISALAGLALLSLLASSFSFAPQVALASALLAGFTTIVSAILVTGTTLFTVVIPNELRGLCMAALTGISVLLGLGFAPVAVSLLSGVTGGPATIGTALAVICGTASLFGGAAFAVGRPHYPRSV